MYPHSEASPEQPPSKKLAIALGRIAQCKQMCAKPIALDGPFVHADTLPLFQREVREALSPTALQRLLSRAEVFVEGGTASGGSARGAFMGTAMLTLDLDAVADRLRAPHDAEMAQKLCTALGADPNAKRAIIRHALEVARARLAAPVNLRGGELTLRTHGARVLIDLELETGEPSGTPA